MLSDSNLLDMLYTLSAAIMRQPLSVHVCSSLSLCKACDPGAR